MPKPLALLLAFFLLAGLAGPTLAAEPDNPLLAGEKAFLAEHLRSVPKDRFKSVDDLYKKWEQVISGGSQAILLDVRSQPEFDAFHIEGSSHIDAGHMSSILRKIKDPSAEIWVFCRTGQRAQYVAGFLCKVGYKNVYLVSQAPEGGESGLAGWVRRGYPVVNYFFGYADKNGIHYSPPPLRERNCAGYIRELAGQRGENCGK